MASIEEDTVALTDLSEGSLGKLRELTQQGQIEEEVDRRTWKNRFLLGGSCIVLLFYGLLVGLIVCRGHVDWHVLVITSAIPTALAFSLLRLVSRPIGESRDEGEIPTPWAKFARELVAAVRELATALKKLN